MPSFWWTVQFSSGFDELFYSQKCFGFGLFVTEAFKLGEHKFRIWHFNIRLLFFYLSSIPTCSMGFIHTDTCVACHLNLSSQRITIELIVLSALKNSSTLNRLYALFVLLFIKAAFVSHFLMAREFILLGWMSRVVWHLHSHMPIRHLWLLITSQPLGLHCSGSHTWLHPDYILPLASLIWLFMGQAALSIGWQNMSQLIGNMVLNKNKHWKQAWPRGIPVLFSWRQTFEITIVLDMGCKIRWLVVFLQAYQFEELVATVYMAEAWTVPVSREWIQAILKILKKKSS